MDRLLTRTPGLERTHRIYSRFTRDERLRERALAREKAIRDEADHLEFAIQKGRAEGELIGLEKGELIGLEKGELKAKTDAVSMILESKFPVEFTVSEREKVRRITSRERLDELMRSTISAASYSEVASLF